MVHKSNLVRTQALGDVFETRCDSVHGLHPTAIQSMKPVHKPSSILTRSAALLIATFSLTQLPAAHAQSTWSGAAADAAWSSAGNWDVAPTDGAALVFGSGFASGSTLGNDLLNSVASLTFNTSLPAGGITLGGNALVLTGGLINNNITAGRNVTIHNPISVSGSQTWSTFADVDAVTILDGGLTGSGNITIGTAIASNGTNLPTLRLGGNNSGYTGTIATTGADTGILLLSPAAQTGGLIDLNSGNRNLWLTANTSATPYTFWTGNATPSVGNPMAVNFRNAGTSGIFLAGGDVHWNPTTSGSDYQWDASRAGALGEIRVNGSNDTVPAPPVPVPNSALPTPRMLFLGNSAGSLVLGGNRTVANGTGGSNAGRVTMNFALSDDGTARQFTTSAGLLLLTRPAGGGGTPNLGGNTVVSGGAMALSSMDRIFNGWLNLSGGVVLLDNLSWSDFTTDRSAGYRASTGAADTWGISGAGGGFAARGQDVNIFISANTADSYGTVTAGTVFNRDFAIGASARADDNSLYANRAVKISQDTVLSAARTIRVNGGNRENLGNWTIDGPVHEFSGAITGAFGLSIGGGGTTTGGTLRLSNVANSFASLSINPSGQAGGVVVLVPDDLVMGSGAVTVGAGAQGQAGMLLFESTAGGQKTFAKSITVAQGADASSGDSGFGSYAGDVLYTGTATVTGSRITLPVQVQSGRFAFGAGSSIVNNSTGATQTYSKGGAGELVLDANTTYAGTNGNFVWALRQGTLTTAAAGKLTGGTGAFDADNLIGQDGITLVNGVTNPVRRTWRVTTMDQSYTTVAATFGGYVTVDVEAGRVLTIDGGALGVTASESLGNSLTTPRWDLNKVGGGTWVFTNTDTAPGFGPNNGAGFLRVDEGTLDLTGDYGRGSLSVNGGTLLSGTFSPFTYSTSGGKFTLGVAQTNLLEVTTAGGKIGISAFGAGDVTRTVGFDWDQTAASTLELASRDDRSLVFSGTTFPDVAVGNTLEIGQDGTGIGRVQINDLALGIAGTLSGSGTLRSGPLGNGLLSIDGILSPGDGIGTLEVDGSILVGPTGAVSMQLGGATPGEGSGFHDQLNLLNPATSFTVDPAATLSLSISGFTPAMSDVFYLITRQDAGGYGAPFAGLPEGGSVSIAGGYTGTITYAANWAGSPGASTLVGGNDVAIFNVVPEPGAAISLLGGFALLAARRPRRR